MRRVIFMNDNNRAEILKEKLDLEKIKIIDKYCLFPDANNVWLSKNENSFEKRIAKQSFLEKNDVLGVVFRINELCAAKLKYFRNNLKKYEPLIYDIDLGFTKTELWNMEFLKHKASGKIIDLRYLLKIHKIEKFEELCKKLEEFEKTGALKNKSYKMCKYTAYNSCKL
jgi:hypothetical protein